MNRILIALRNKYANLGLSEKAFTGVATFLEKTGLKDDEIEARIAEDDVKALLIAIQGETDFLRTQNHKLTKENATLKAKKDDKSDDDSNDEPDGDNAVMNAIRTLSEQFTAFKTDVEVKSKQRQQDEIIAKAHELMKAAGCTNDYIRKATLKGITVSDADTAEAIAERYKIEYDKNFKEAFGDGIIPPYAQQTSKEYRHGDFSSIVERYKAEGRLPSEE